MITELQFRAYNKCRDSGRVNMLNTTVVSRLSGLPIDVVFEIMNNYDILEVQFGKGD